ncbi:hypothetical protein KR009_003010, partial [Drosophila setifemur]
WKMATKFLSISPNGPLTFSKAFNTQEIVIRNIGHATVTYKVLQSTVFGKFNIRPRWGLLKGLGHAHVLVTRCKDAELSKKGRDKIVIVCMLAPINQVDFHSTSSFWRYNICYHPKIEKHQLTCEEISESGAKGDQDVAKDKYQEQEQEQGDINRSRTIVNSQPLAKKHWR